MDIHAERPVVQPDAHRPEAADALKVQRRVLRVGLQSLAALVRQLPHRRRSDARPHAALGD